MGGVHFRGMARSSLALAPAQEGFWLAGCGSQTNIFLYQQTRLPRGGTRIFLFRRGQSPLRTLQARTFPLSTKLKSSFVTSKASR
jgi:hypothetical protein